MSFFKKLRRFFSALTEEPMPKVDKPDPVAESQANEIEFERLQNNVGRGFG